MAPSRDGRVDAHIIFATFVCERRGVMDIDRRTLIGGAAALPLSAPAASAAAAGDYWESIAREYDVTREVIQLEHGNWGMMARPVLAAYRANVERVNRDTSYYARRTMV